MDLENERALIQQARTDKKAFTVIYENNYQRIFNYVLKRTADLDAAQDITSEVFLKAFRKIWQFQFRRIPFSAWLYRIATNEISNYFKKGKYKTVSLEDLLEKKGIEPSLEENPRTTLIEAEETQKQNQEFYKIQAHLKKLPLKFQTIIILKFFEKKSLKEISQIIGKKEGTVKSSLSRGLEKLRKLIAVDQKILPRPTKISSQGNFFENIEL